MILFAISMEICVAWQPSDSTKIDSSGSSVKKELICYVSIDQRFITSTGNIVVLLSHTHSVEST